MKIFSIQEADQMSAPNQISNKISYLQPGLDTKQNTLTCHKGVSDISTCQTSNYGNQHSAEQASSLSFLYPLATETDQLPDLRSDITKMRLGN